MTPEKFLPLAALQQIEAAALQLLAAVRHAGTTSPTSSVSLSLASPTPAQTVVDLCNAFLLAKARAGRSDRYLALLVKELRSFTQGREQRPAASIPSAEIEAWLYSNEKWGARTRRNRLLNVRTLFAWAVKRGELVGNPALGVDIPEVEDPPPSIHTPAEVRAVLEAARLTDLAAMRCLAIRYFAGLRGTEAIALEEKEIQLERGFIEVTALKAKKTRRGRRRRLVKIEPNLKAWLELGGELPLRQANNRLSWAVQSSGVKWPKNVTRHSFCSYHLAHFGSAARTALEAGHTEEMLFGNYRELVTQEEAAGYWQIFPSL